MNDCDVRCDELLHKIAEELGVELDSRLEFYQMFDEYDKKYVDIHESTYGHRMFGYPHFRQWDPRGVEAADYYDTLLFQLDSDYWKNQWRILWGDAGVGAFLSIVKNLRNWILAMYCIVGTVISGYTNCRKGEKDVSGNSNNSCFE